MTVGRAAALLRAEEASEVRASTVGWRYPAGSFGEHLNTHSPHSIEGELESVSAEPNGAGISGSVSSPDKPQPVTLGGARAVEVDSPTVPPFPLSALPQPLANLAAEAASAHGFPADFVAVPGLAVIAAAAGGCASLHVKRGFDQRPILWTGVVAPPGTGKSPAQALVTRSLRDADMRAAQDHARDYDDWEARGAEDTARGPEPLATRYVLDDYTVEAVAPIHVANPAGLLIEKDELAGLVKANDQYRGGKGADRQRLLSWWTGASQRVDRVKTGSRGVIVPAPTLCITGGIQPGVVDVLGGADGMAARFLLVYFPHLKASYPSFDESRIGAETAWVRLVLGLIAGRERGDLTFTLSAPSAARFHAEQCALVDLRNGGTLPTAACELAAKLDVHIARTACALHAAHRAMDQRVGLVVDPETIENAITIGRYFLSHCVAYAPAGPNLLATPQERQREIAVEALRASLLRTAVGRISRRDIMRKKIAGVRTMQDADKLLDAYDGVYGGVVKVTRGGTQTREAVA